MIRSVIADWKILLTDKYSLRILSAACKMHNILEENVTLVEDISKKRQPYVQMDAIYFISPIESSVQQAINDFRGQPLYAAAHFFFIGAVSDELFQLISSNNIKQYIRNFKEMYIDFVAIEARVFSFDMPNIIPELYSSQSTFKDMNLNVCSRKLLSLCATLQDIPNIRYYSSQDTMISPKIAALLQDELDEYKKHVGDYDSGTLLILDRSWVAITPFVHEYTYQAMACDLLDIENDRYTYTETSTKTKKQAVIDETDPLWIEYRHTHIAECISGIKSSFDKFMHDNKGLASNTKDARSLNEMKNALNSLPQFQEKKARFAVHLNMAQECMSMFEKMQLPLVSGVEQDIVTGFASDGSVVKDCMNELVGILTNPSIDRNEKLKLIILYIVCRDGISNEKKQKITQAANLNSQELALISNLTLLGLKVVKDKHSQTRLRVQQQKKGSSEYELSRYTPPLKQIIRSCVNNTLDATIFPYIKNPGSISQRPVASLRSARPKWQSRSKAKGFSGNRLIVFVAGGLTFSEIREVYKLSEELQREIIIGATEILTPNSFLQSVRELKK